MSAWAIRRWDGTYWNHQEYSAGLRWTQEPIMASHWPSKAEAKAAWRAAVGPFTKDLEIVEFDVAAAKAHYVRADNQRAQDVVDGSES